MPSFLLLLSPSLQRWEYPVTLAVIILLTLALLLGIEKMAERGSGWHVQWGARLFIPLPALLLLVANLRLHYIRVGLGQLDELDLILYPAAFIAFCLPWVISSGDGRETPVWLVFGVWAS